MHLKPKNGLYLHFPTKYGPSLAPVYLEKPRSRWGKQSNCQSRAERICIQQRHGQKSRRGKNCNFLTEETTSAQTFNFAPEFLQNGLFSPKFGFLYEKFHRQLSESPKYKQGRGRGKWPPASQPMTPSLVLMQKVNQFCSVQIDAK